MRLQLTLAAAGFAAILIAGPSHACGNGECDPPVKVEPPPVKADPPVVVDPPPVVVDPPIIVEPPPVVVVPPPADIPSGSGDGTYVAGPIIHYAFCCADDGKPSWRTALFRDPVQAALQCQARALRYEQAGQSLPECPRKRRARE
jgi:hypothetical protein